MITAINGFVAGGGLGLALAGDIVIAAESAKFTSAYTNSGLTPDGGSTYILPRLIGVRRTAELLFTKSNALRTRSISMEYGNAGCSR
ncbi:MAG: hypothetical protein HC892_18295 [Saprospiraceae bacterium]|nr:hypothetical protein [Saprospiraceae bacterium]